MDVLGFWRSPSNLIFEWQEGLLSILIRGPVLTILVHFYLLHIRFRFQKPFPLHFLSS